MEKYPQLRIKNIQTEMLTIKKKNQYSGNELNCVHIRKRLVNLWISQ